VSTRIHTILVVDDEPMIRESVARYLEECGFIVFEASGAEEAIALLRKPDTRIDLVFSDVTMPGSMDGFGLAQWVRASLPDVFIILTSGDAMKANMAKALCIQEPLLAKPYRLEFVAEKIRTALRARYGSGEGPVDEHGRG